MDEIKLLLKILNIEVRKIREDAQDGCDNSSSRGAQDFLGRKLGVVSNDLPHSKQLNTLSLRFLDKRVKKKHFVSSLKIGTGYPSKKAVSCTASINLAVEMTGENWFGMHARHKF